MLHEPEYDHTPGTVSSYSVAIEMKKKLSLQLLNKNMHVCDVHVFCMHVTCMSFACM